MKGITAPPRIIRLCPVVLARSSIKPRPRKRTVSANLRSVFTNMPLTTLSHKRAHLCWRKDALPVTQRPIWNGERVCATNGFQRRCDNQRRRSHAEKTRRPAIKLSTLQVCINKMPDGRHLSTHMKPTTIRWTQLARATHKNWDDTHLHGNPLRTDAVHGLYGSSKRP